METEDKTPEQLTPEKLAIALEQRDRKLQQKKPIIFGFKLGNVPSMNFRSGFARNLKAINEITPEALRSWKSGKTATHVVFSDPDDYHTMLLRGTIAGIESIIRGAVFEQLLFARRMTRDLDLELKGLQGGNMAELHYNKLPSKVDPALRLSICNKALWKQVQPFYSQVRNPLMHGDQLYEVKAESLRECFQMFQEILGWVDSWCDPRRFERFVSSGIFHVIPKVDSDKK